jgi:predicted nuclease with RNAse H fold
MIVCGIDLSGPANVADTAIAVFKENGNVLRLQAVRERATDEEIVDIVYEAARAGSVVVGLDAPLSYNPGGGDRPGDALLRLQITASGLRSGSVMPPTLTRMVYLTLRGIAVARSIEATCRTKARIVEVHPSACMVLRGADAKRVRTLRKSVASRRYILDWLGKEGIRGLRALGSPTDHVIASCACVLAGWKWHSGESAWMMEASPPHHPYDFAC